MDSLRVVRPPTLVQLVADKLRAAIVAGEFQPGQRLVELDLSTSFGVSRAPLREALRILAGEGLIRTEQNRGCTVVNPSTDELEQMVLFRAVVEGTAARLLTARRDFKALDQLTEIHRGMVAARQRKDSISFLKLYWQFHGGLVASSENLFIINSWSAISTTFRIFISKSHLHFAEGDEVMSTIGGFLQLFRDGDPVLAERVVRSMTVWAGFALLGSHIPREVSSYVTHLVAPGARVVAIDPHQLEAQLRPQAANHKYAEHLNGLSTRQHAAI
jgi:DNA-binding GntR family transcriptional regulator